jgi:NADH:ubiquinone oxidoreductase subunit 2 (subunit N)
MSGIPPLAGFIGKFLIFNFLFLTHKYMFVIVFSLLNFFSVYFYIQNLRFLISKTQYNHFLICGYYVFFSKNLLNLLVFLNCFNFFSILYLEDSLYLFIYIVSYKSLF